MRRPISTARTLPECRPGSYEIDACPSSSWIERRSAPPSNRWVANECRKACGEAPATPAACRAHTRRRRRTSDVERRRPDFEMNSARSVSAVASARAAAAQVALDRLQGRLARRDEAGLAALPLHPHAARRRSRSRRGRGSRAPRRAARTHTPARTARGRAARARCRRGCGRAARRPRPPSARAEAARRGAARTAGRRGSAPARRARRACGTALAARRACARRCSAPGRARSGRAA